MQITYLGKHRNYLYANNHFKQQTPNVVNSKLTYYFINQSDDSFGISGTPKLTFFLIITNPYYIFPFLLFEKNILYVSLPF